MGLAGREDAMDLFAFAVAFSASRFLSSSSARMISFFVLASKAFQSEVLKHSGRAEILMFSDPLSGTIKVQIS